jgi:NitT/TauT family transport system substrate-binding protein
MNSKHLLRISTIAIVTFTASLLLMAVGAQAKSPARLKLGYAPGGGSILAFIAQDQKLFAKEGIEVELVQFSSTGDGLNALNSGKIDIGLSFGTAAPLTFISKGSDFTIIGGALSGGHPVIALPARAGQFKSIKDFKGKTVAVPRLYTADVVWRGALKRAGIDSAKDLKIIELKNPSAVLEAVKSGKVDVGIGASSIFLQAKESGLAIVGWSNDFFPQHPCCRIVAKGKSINGDPAVYRAFLRALLQAEKIKDTNPKLAQDITKRYMNIDDKLAASFVHEPHQHVSVDPDKKRVKQMWHELKDINYVTSDLDINRYINTQLYSDALNELLRRQPKDRYYLDAKVRFEKQNF